MAGGGRSPGFRFAHTGYARTRCGRVILCDMDSDESKAADNSSLRLTDQQVAEVRRRLSERDPETMTLVEFNQLVRRRYDI